MQLELTQSWADEDDEDFKHRKDNVCDIVKKAVRSDAFWPHNTIAGVIATFVEECHPEEGRDAARKVATFHRPWNSMSRTRASLGIV